MLDLKRPRLDVLGRTDTRLPVKNVTGGLVIWLSLFLTATLFVFLARAAWAGRIALDFGFLAALRGALLGSLRPCVGLILNLLGALSSLLRIKVRRCAL